MRYWLVIGIGLFFSLTSVQAQEATVIYSLNDRPEEVQDVLDEEYEVLLKYYQGDMEKAMKDWYGFLTSLEKFAEAEAVNIDGVKVWLNVFSRPDGSLKAVGYHPKSGSKKMDWAVFEALLKEFSKQYQYPVEMKQPYSHYAAAMWPVQMLNR